MKAKTILLLMLISLSATFNIAAQEIILVSNINSVDSKNLIFGLPKTTLVLDRDLMEIRTFEGDEKSYNTLFTKEVEYPSSFINSKDTSYKFLGGKLITRADLDESSLYQVKADKKWNKKNTIGLQISQKGLLTGANLESKDLTFKIISTVFTTIAAVALVDGKNVADEQYNREENGKKMFNSFQTDWINDNSKIGKALVNIFEQRAKIDKRIKELSKTLNQLMQGVLIQGNFPGGFDKTKFRVNQLQENIKALKTSRAILENKFLDEMDKVFGKKTSNKIKYSHDVSINFPFEETSIIKYIGISDKSDNLTISENLQAEYDSGKCTCVKLEILPVNQSFTMNRQTQIATEGNGMPYKFPIAYNAQLSSPIKNLGNTNFIAAGTKGRLNSDVNISEIVYFENLGWIKSFKGSTKAISDEDIKSGSEVLKTGLTSVKNKSEFEILKEETDLLELQLKKLKTESDIQSITNPTAPDDIIQEN
ncbi:hypothetical protein [Pareuzebyella sediminis]|uniref:hypothetical protein n=1 Tax=Pareuzebyella sediminis TaxID=2607998 RepID=UPI0011EF3C51|nr:hypothetical protein [Pareuzebyella sediminis]